jgi:hypothetical protein
MPSEIRERHYLAQLRSCLPLPSGRAEKQEPPDFLLGDPPRRVGIELTEYHHPPSSGERPFQEVQTLKARVVALAERLHAQAGGPALYVRCTFGRHGRLTKERVKPIAQTLAGAVLSHHVPLSVEEPDVMVSRSLLPQEIAQAHVFGSLDGEDRLWTADHGGWVAPVRPSDVQREIDRKRRIVEAARMKCQELWLVIVYDWCRAAPCKLSSEAQEAEYIHPFDRVVWLDPNEPQAIELHAQAG